MDLGVTYRGAVDPWECDQMEHLNVRFYGRRFSEAEAHAFATLGTALRAAVDETIQFAREIRRGAAVRIETTQTGPDQLRHRLFDEGHGEPAATLDARYGTSPDPLFDAAGLDWRETGRGVAHPADVGRDYLTREALLRFVNHAAAHLGLDRHRQRDAGGRLATGSATVACRLCRHGPMAAGSLAVVRSRWGRAGRTSVRLQHLLSDAGTGAPSATAEATVVFFDMATRRPVPLPDALRQACTEGIRA